MKGKIAAFFRIFGNLLIGLCHRSGLVDSLYHMSDSCVDLFISHDFLGRIHEQDIDRCRQFMLLLAPRFADKAFAQISLHRSLETFLRNGYKNPGMVTSCVLSDEIAHARNISVTPLGKQFLNERLAAESFFFFESI
jgi:hypothetical protein